MQVVVPMQGAGEPRRLAQVTPSVRGGQACVAVEPKAQIFPQTLSLYPPPPLPGPPGSLQGQSRPRGAQVWGECGSHVLRYRQVSLRPAGAQTRGLRPLGLESPGVRLTHEPGRGPPRGGHGAGLPEGVLRVFLESRWDLGLVFHRLLRTLREPPRPARLQGGGHGAAAGTVTLQDSLWAGECCGNSFGNERGPTVLPPCGGVAWGQLPAPTTAAPCGPFPTGDAPFPQAT